MLPHSSDATMPLQHDHSVVCYLHLICGRVCVESKHFLAKLIFRNGIVGYVHQWSEHLLTPNAMSQSTLMMRPGKIDEEGAEAVVDEDSCA